VEIKMPSKPVMLGIATEAALYVTMAVLAPPNSRFVLIVTGMGIWLVAQVVAAVAGILPMPPSGKAGRTFLFFGMDGFLVSALFAFGPGVTAGVLLGLTGAILLFTVRKGL
jgi:hypothetical protein